MLVKINIAVLNQTKWYEYALRFFFGGVVTVLVGLIAQRFGPVVGGLFLAFPAIFPASATLIEKHETRKKQRAGIIDHQRGRKEAALDACGAAMGCIGLGVFGVLVWRLATVWNPWLCLLAALGAWFVTSALIWRLSKNFTR